MKNIDKIRQMNSEEFAKFIENICTDCCHCPLDKYCDEMGRCNCEDKTKQWLEQEVEE